MYESSSDFALPPARHAGDTSNSQQKCITSRGRGMLAKRLLRFVMQHSSVKRQIQRGMARRIMVITYYTFIRHAEETIQKPGDTSTTQRLNK